MWPLNTTVEITSFICNFLHFKRSVAPMNCRKTCIISVWGCVCVWGLVVEPAGPTKSFPQMYNSILRGGKNAIVHCNELLAFMWKSRLGHDLEDSSVRTVGTLCSHVEPLCGMCGHAPAFQQGEIWDAESSLKPQILLHVQPWLCILSGLVA